MSKNSKILYIISGITIALMITIIVMGISSSKGPRIINIKNIYAYNPLDSILTIEIDKDQYTLQNSEKIEIPISIGEHKITSYYNKKILIDSTILIRRYMEKRGALINVSNQPMYLYTEIYIPEKFDKNATDMMSLLFKLKIKEENSQISLIDNVPIIGEVEIYPENQLVIDNHWDYDIDESFEDKIERESSIYKMGSLDPEHVTKIFSKIDLKKYSRKKLNWILENK